MFVDAHLDLAWNALDWNRDLALTVTAIRQREAELGVKGKARGVNTVSLPAMRQGGVGLAVATLLARLYRSDLVPGLQRYESMPGAHGAARQGRHVLKAAAPYRGAAHYIARARVIAGQGPGRARQRGAIDQL